MLQLSAFPSHLELTHTAPSFSILGCAEKKQFPSLPKGWNCQAQWRSSCRLCTCSQDGRNIQTRKHPYEALCRGLLLAGRRTRASGQLRIQRTTASDSEGVYGASRQQTVTPTHHHSAANYDGNTNSRRQHSCHHHDSFLQSRYESVAACLHLRVAQFSLTYSIYRY